VIGGLGPGLSPALGTLAMVSTIPRGALCNLATPIQTLFTTLRPLTTCSTLSLLLLVARTRINANTQDRSSTRSNTAHTPLLE
jgi:hypothetical protein